MIVLWRRVDEARTNVRMIVIDTASALVNVEWLFCTEPTDPTVRSRPTVSKSGKHVEVATY